MENAYYLELFLQKTRDRIDCIRKQLEQCPEGRLYVQKKNGKPYYFRQYEENGMNVRQGLNRTPETIDGLIRRRLLLDELKSLEAISAEMDSFIRKNPPFDLFRACELMKNRIPGLSDDLIARALAMPTASEWENEYYEQSNYRPEEKKHITSRGLRVRSKSELLIVGKYYEFNVAFRYEQVLRVGNSIIVPDFTIRRSDGKIFYWEHEGMMSSKVYAERQYQKNQLYASLGIVPWDNLIVTYDDVNGNIDLRIIESEIRNKLLI